ncbi:SDR family oxidoreductase [Pelagibacterium xiamenense]|uniref:SDR family oxidoreductase n=1 Tax=Pelagibacterium xiamenense TaxID=2901140 RepID=UPI001E3420A1|nr:SDR family oxidoreductase [Pelagibacterium xiamenense]MCD7059136.1 SDR family oxidoreductase [Pelagibacterium xiamenense]
MSASVAIVTGAGGDIGRAIARKLMRADRVVVLADKDKDAADRSAAALSHDGCSVAIACDVTDPTSVAAMIAEASGHGGIDLLVNNAGASLGVSLQSSTPESWAQDVALNLNGAFHCFHAAADHLKANAGAVVNIASVNGTGTFGHPAYSSAKAGLIHFTRMIAVEYGKFGVRANAVAPGTVRTQAWEERAQANPNVFEEARRWYPLERIARPEDIANAVTFLAGPEAAAITGVCLPVDCGLSAGQAELARTFAQSTDF